MRASYEALSCRARGLATHLLSDDRLAALERAADLGVLERMLRETSYAPFLPPREDREGSLEVCVDRALAWRIRVLARWAWPAERTLAPVFLSEDLRTIRGIVRGTLGGLAPEKRLAGAIPTPSLDRRSLEALAHSESVSSVAATLTVWGHPFGSALLVEAGRPHPDPYRLETVLARAFAQHASASAKRLGRPMRRFVADTIDTRNVTTALLLAGAPSETPLIDLFVDGGAHLTRDDFVRAAGAESRAQCAQSLADATRDTLFMKPLRDGSPSPSPVEARILQARIERLVIEARLTPVSILPVLLYLHRLRREVLSLRRAVWGASMRAGRVG